MKTPRSGFLLRKRELFRSIGYEPHPGQVLVHRSKAPRRVVAAGVRFGKSTCGAMEAVAYLLEPREASMGWIAAPNYSNADRIFERVAQVLHVHFRHRILDFSPRDHRIVVSNLGGGTSEMRTKTADNPVSLLGEGLDWLIIDEAARVEANVWDNYLSPRLVDKNGTALLLSTPNGRNWFYRMYRRGQQGRTPGYESWKSPSFLNPHLNQALIEAERATLPGSSFSEQYDATFIGEDLEPCEQCGGPSLSPRATLLVFQGEETGDCSVCGGRTDFEGRTLVGRLPDGRVVAVKTIHLPWPRGCPPPLPTVVVDAAASGPDARDLSQQNCAIQSSHVRQHEP